jgi:hypothetical protein
VPPKDSRIYQEIEATAGFYGPSLYGGLESEIMGLLTHYHDLMLTADAEGVGYTPLTPVKLDPRQAKLFAVGVLPPSAKVTGRILDRSMTIAKQAEFNPEHPNDNVGKTKAEGSAPGSGWGSAVGALTPEFWDSFVGMCRRIGVDPVEWASIVYNESGFDPTAANYGVPNTAAWRQRQEDENPIAVGLNQFIRSSAKSTGMTDEEFDSHGELSAEEQLYWMEQYLKMIRAGGKSRGALYSQHFGGLNNPDGSNYASIRGQNYYVNDQIAAGLIPPGTTRYDIFNRSDFQDRAYNLNKGFDTDNAGVINQADLERKVRNLPPTGVVAAIRAAEERMGDGFPRSGPRKPGSEDTEGRHPGWETEGKADAAAALREREKTANVPLNQRQFGKKLQAAQRQAIAEAQAALEGMKRLPPLRLLVNPQQFAVKGSKIVTDGNWSRYGPIIEHWGNEQDVISASGKVAAFYTAQTGLTRAARQFSASWRNFQSLYLLYKNNGGVYLRDPFDTTGQTKRLTYVGSIYIYYDGILYVGSFSSFNVTEEDSAPYTVSYSFEFQVRAAFILDRPDDKYDIQYASQAPQATSKQNQQSEGQPKQPLPTKSQPITEQKRLINEEQAAELREAIAITTAAREEAAASKAAANKEAEDLFKKALAASPRSK